VTPVLAIVRAPQATVVSALQPDSVGTVGPTSSAGWTVGWIPDVAPLSGLGDTVSIDENDDGGVRLRVDTDGTTQVWAQSVSEGERQDPHEAAQALCDVFGRADRLAEVRSALDDADTSFADDIVARLDEILDLPELWGPERLREITVQRGDPTVARLAARLAAREIGPTDLASLEDTWTALRAAGGRAAQDVLTVMVAAGSSKRRSVVFTLWRGSDAAAGFELVRGSDVIAGSRWNTGWRDLAGEDPEARDAEAHVLAQQIGDNDVDLVALRSLMRARSRRPDPLAELFALLDLPVAVLALLDEQPDAAEWRSVKPAARLRLVWEYAKEIAAEPLVEARWLQVMIAVILTVVTFFGLAAAVVGYGALITNGALIDQQGVTAGDVAVTILVTFAIPLNLWSAVRLVRRGTLSELARSHVGGGSPTPTDHGVRNHVRGAGDSSRLW
jgi:hypothetical protein